MRRIGSYVFVLFFMILAASANGAWASQIDNYGLFRYGGICEADGRKANLQFRITPDNKVVDGKLFADGVCKLRSREVDTRITFQGILSQGKWESDGAIITGSWTGGDYGCNGGKMEGPNWPDSGGITITFQSNGWGEYSVRLSRVGGYVFEAAGKTYDPSIDLERQGDRARGKKEYQEAYRLYKEALDRSTSHNRKNYLKTKIGQVEKELAKNSQLPGNRLKGYWYEKNDKVKNVYLIFKHIKDNIFSASITGAVDFNITGEAVLKGQHLQIQFSHEDDYVTLNLTLLSKDEMSGTWKNKEGDSGNLSFIRSDETIRPASTELRPGLLSPLQGMFKQNSLSDGDFHDVITY
ncbi:MAG: hypothetical protein CSA26_09725 [Desulfobacterales bacterium]|nr:MAG: hypothetical protein CSA26_09725 [Desulfobacterales bacterium]